MSIQDNQWFADITDFFEEHGGSLSQDQRGELHELCTHVPRRSESGDLWYRRFGEEAVKNLKLTKERDALAERDALQAEVQRLTGERDAARTVMAQAVERMESLHVYDTRDAGPCYVCDPINEIAEDLRAILSAPTEKTDNA
jgi:hypothetical protein